MWTQVLVRRCSRPLPDIQSPRLMLRCVPPKRALNLGVNLNQWGKSDYVSRSEEYLRTQEIAAVATFHERQGLLAHLRDHQIQTW